MVLVLSWPSKGYSLQVTLQAMYIIVSNIMLVGPLVYELHNSTKIKCSCTHELCQEGILGVQEAPLYDGLKMTQTC